MAGALSRKQWFALIVAVTLTAHYFFFRVPFVANDYGRNMAEWPLLADALITFPVLYYFMLRPSLKQFLLAWLAIATVGVLAGRLLIPDESKQLWRSIEGYWLLLVMAEIVLELYLMLLLVRRVQALLRLSGNVDEALRTAIHSRFGKSGFAPFAFFEMRIWYYGLFMRKGEQLRFCGEQHFSYDKNDGNVSNQFAFIMMIVFELPLTHFMMHLMSVKPWIAWTADILTLWSMLYLVAEYRASQWRPVSLDRDALLIRYGVFASDREIAYSAIESVVRCDNEVRRQRGILRYRQMGRLNVEIRLRESESHTKIYLSLDKPDAFIEALRQRLLP